MAHGPRPDVAAFVVALLACVVTSVTASAAPRQQAGTVPINQEAQLIVDFQKRAQEYADLHRKLDGTLPDLPKPPSPAQVDAHERALTRLIAQARGRAQHGDIFTKESRAYFRRQIAHALSGPDAGQVRDSIMDENPGRIRLRINGRYPDEIPRSTMPPQLLAALPKLPEELEYRFIGDRLILLDFHANLVVDYIDDALPR
ncbi:MAG: hypothetical protein ACRD15_17880 [Vicinamibacterales bacterium]